MGHQEGSIEKDVGQLGTLLRQDHDVGGKGEFILETIAKIDNKGTYTYTSYDEQKLENTPSVGSR